jgi:hypothetical protein
MLPFIAIAQALSAISAVAGTYMSIQGQKSAAKAAEQSAEWNADQARKQATYEEGIAQENMRRTRENNRRQLARQRATGARSGLKETGAVGDMLVDTSERLQQDIDDIWDKASTRSSQLEGEASMSLWEGKQAKQASKYAIYGTVAKGAGGVASSLGGSGIFGSSTPTPNPNQTSPLKALPYKPKGIYVDYSGK